MSLVDGEAMPVYLPYRGPDAPVVGRASMDDDGDMLIHVFAWPLDGRVKVEVTEVIRLRNKVKELRAELAAARAREDA